MTASLNIWHTYMKSELLRADSSSFRMSSTNCYFRMMLFTNSSPSCLMFSSAKMDPKRFLALHMGRVTSYR